MRSLISQKFSFSFFFFFSIRKFFQKLKKCLKFVFEQRTVFQIWLIVENQQVA